MAMATLCLASLYFLPLWRITLQAPQFPGGLHMDIWINKIGGTGGSNIIQNINILNHYIGMKPVEPDAIPELSYFPYIVAGMIVLAILTIVFNKAKGYFAWGILLLILSGIGLYDFYLWEYDYGHDLDPKAPIKVPGMVYQPPLFGRKDLLNFVAYSYPAAGGILMGCSLILSFLAAGLHKIRPRLAVNKAAIIMIMFSVAGCTPTLKEIEFGSDQCRFCKMIIADPRFGAEAVTDKGKVYMYDALECMIEDIEQEENLALLAAIGFESGGQLSLVSDLSYLISPNVPSPMGANLSAFSKKEKALQYQQIHSGKIYSWDELVKYRHDR